MTDLLAVIDRLYEAVLDPSRWEAALDGIAAAAGGFGASIIPLAAPTGAMRIIATGVTKEHQHDWEGGWWRIDPRGPRAFSLGPGARVITDHDIITPDEVARDAFYQEFWRPRGFGDTLAQLARPLPQHAVCISVHRDARKGPFERAGIDVMTTLGRHAARAVALSAELAAARMVRATLAEAFDLIAAGIVLLGRGGVVTHINKAGEALLGDGIAIGHGRLLRASRPADQAELDRLVGVAHAASGDLPLARTAILHRPSGKRPLLAHALPIRRRPADVLDHILFGDARAFVVIIDPDVGAPPSLADSLRLYGLTAAEARVAAMVGSGQAPRDVAEALGTSEGTVRIQIKRAFEKLDISRQSELARVVTRLAALAAPEAPP
jgi:DNA-binding CsgD family transcriptional regulator